MLFLSFYSFQNCFSYSNSLPAHINIRILLPMCIKILVEIFIGLIQMNLGRIDIFTIICEHSMPVQVLGCFEITFPRFYNFHHKDHLHTLLNLYLSISFFSAVVNRITFSSSDFTCSLSVYRVCSWFLCVNLVSYHLIELISSRSNFANSFGVFYVDNYFFLQIEAALFILFQCICLQFLFSCLLALKVYF